MKIKDVNIKMLALLLFAVALFLQACEEERIYPRTRLFQPVLNEDLYSVDNSIIVNLGKMVEAEKYKVEVSRDSFETVLYTLEIDSNYVVLNEENLGEELLWFTIYQVQVTAYADEEAFNSLPSFLGSVRTQKFPSNMGVPTFFDILDTRAKVFWTPVGDPINRIKVFSIEDERLSDPLKTFNLLQADIDSNRYVAIGLEPLTTYQIAIFSGDVLRGWEIYTTREAQISGDNVVDLTNFPDSTEISLKFRLADVADGSIILLAGGMTYTADGYAFDKSIDFVSGYSFVPALPLIDLSSNFNLVEASNVGYVTFKDIHLTASDDGFNARYVFNINVSANLGELKFESCVIRTLRGICRMKDSGPGILDNYTITNCMIDSIRDYGLLTVDIASWQCNNILIENTTVSKARGFLGSYTNATSVVIDGCTLHELPEATRIAFRWRGDPGQNDVTDGITISNTIWSHGWDHAESGSSAFDPFDGLESTNWNIVNTYATSEFAVSEGNDEIPGFPSVSYPGLTTELWTDPYNSVFDFLDVGFAGKGDSGDPRWRIGL